MPRFYHRKHLASTPTTLSYLNLLRARELRSGGLTYHVRRRLRVKSIAAFWNISFDLQRPQGSFYSVRVTSYRYMGEAARQSPGSAIFE